MPLAGKMEEIAAKKMIQYKMQILALQSIT